MKYLALLLLCGMALGQTYTGRHTTIISTPAAGSQATVSAAAKDNTKHVADWVCFSGAASTAPTATQLNINLRDGATGAGTVVWTMVVVAAASATTNVGPYCAYFPNGVWGSNNTAMTLEWSASLANEFESVTLGYHDMTTN